MSGKFLNKKTNQLEPIANATHFSLDLLKQMREKGAYFGDLISVSELQICSPEQQKGDYWYHRPEAANYLLVAREDYEDDVNVWIYDLPDAEAVEAMAVRIKNGRCTTITGIFKLPELTRMKVELKATLVAA